MSLNGVDQLQCEIPLLQLWLALTVFADRQICRPPFVLRSASFEFQPMLSAGEQLRKLTITVEQLLDCSAKVVREWDGVLHKDLGTQTMAALTLSPKDGDVVYPCSSILVTVKRKCEDSDSSSLRVLVHCVSRRLVSTRSSSISVYL